MMIEPFTSFLTQDPPKYLAWRFFVTNTINDGRSKKNNGDAVMLRNQERRKGRYKCALHGKHHAVSGDLSFQKQKHRSLVSRSVERCNTHGKAHILKPILTMCMMINKPMHGWDVNVRAFICPLLLRAPEIRHGTKDTNNSNISSKEIVRKSNREHFSLTGFFFLPWMLSFRPIHLCRYMVAFIVAKMRIFPSFSMCLCLCLSPRIPSSQWKRSVQKNPPFSTRKNCKLIAFHSFILSN